MILFGTEINLVVVFVFFLPTSPHHQAFKMESSNIRKMSKFEGIIHPKTLFSAVFNHQKNVSFCLCCPPPHTQFACFWFHKTCLEFCGETLPNTWKTKLRDLVAWNKLYRRGETQLMVRHWIFGWIVPFFYHDWYLNNLVTLELFLLSEVILCSPQLKHLRIIKD